MENRDKQLGESDRIAIANIAANWMIEEFGYLPKIDDFVRVSKVLVGLFPCFKLKTSEDGIVSVQLLFFLNFLRSQ